MRKIKLIASICIILLSTAVLINCSNDKEETFETTLNAKVDKISFLKIETSKKGESELNAENYLDYVLFDNIPANEFIANNNIDKDSFVSLIMEKADTFSSEYSYKSSILAKDELTLEEIRDAMINECQNGYCCGLDDACEIAVKIAYHIKKFQE